MKEAELYPPVKAYLEAQGYEVKGEIGEADVMAVRAGDPPVIVELKTGFTLALVMQGVARQRLFDHVYLAVPQPGDRGWTQRYKDVVRLCRRLGLGLLTVGEEGATAHLDPGPYAPRRDARRAGRLLREFERREGDPEAGGTTGTPRMTAYRQDALRCAGHLAAEGPSRGRDVAAATGVVRATRLMADDHYGWFERAERGVYALTPKGETAAREAVAAREAIAAPGGG